jgi:hypothetical protein
MLGNASFDGLFDDLATRSATVSLDDEDLATSLAALLSRFGLTPFCSRVVDHVDSGLLPVRPVSAARGRHGRGPSLAGPQPV